MHECGRSRIMWTPKSKSSTSTPTTGNFTRVEWNYLRSQQEAGEEPHVFICYFNHKQWQLVQRSFSTWWNWQGYWVKKEVSQVLSERRDPLVRVFWRKPSKVTFTNSIYFVADGSFTVDGGPL